MNDLLIGGSTPLERIRSRFLRCIVSDIHSFLMPNLASEDALERANYIAMVLLRFAGDFDVTPAAFLLMADAFHLELRRSIDLLRSITPEVQLTRQFDEHGKQSATDLTADQRVFQVRSYLAQCVRLLAAIDPLERRWPEVDRQLNSIAILEQRWFDIQESIEKERAPASDSGPSAGYQRITPAEVTHYLRSHFPTWPDILASDVKVLAGGRSKKTAIVTIVDGPDWLQTVVLRQDSGVTHMGTNVGGEMAILNAINDKQLPVPRVFHFEPNATALGPSFLLMQRLEGQAAGSFFSFSMIDQKLMSEIAQALARLHLLDPQKLGLLAAGKNQDENERLKYLIRFHWNKWREGAVEPSPTIEYAFHWLLRKCDKPLRGNAIVHGDYRPQNLLTQNGHLTGILDWEFAHVGNPAEDLAYLRSVVTPIMPWSEFSSYYEAAGGEKYDETTLQIYEVWWMLRLGALAVGAVEGLLNGTTDDLPQGAGGLVVLPMFERRLAGIICQDPTQSPK